MAIWFSWVIQWEGSHRSGPWTWETFQSQGTCTGNHRTKTILWGMNWGAVGWVSYSDGHNWWRRLISSLDCWSSQWGVRGQSNLAFYSSDWVTTSNWPLPQMSLPNGLNMVSYETMATWWGTMILVERCSALSLWVDLLLIWWYLEGIVSVLGQYENSN